MSKRYHAETPWEPLHTVLNGKLKGQLVEIKEKKHRPNAIHKDIYLCETGDGHRYWVLKHNLTPGVPY